MLFPEINIQIAMRKLFGIPYLIAAIAIFATIYGCEKEETNGGTQTVAVSGVSLSKTTLSLVEGGSETLTSRTFSDRSPSRSGRHTPKRFLIFSANSSDKEHSVWISPVTVFPPKGIDAKCLRAPS